ncbi:MAG: EamA family transporter [Verrucomicrobiota bacterium]
MTPLSFALVFVALFAFVVGQLVLKKAMEASNAVGFGARKFLLPFAAGILFMTVSFFLILGLLQRYDLSYIYPFQGLSVIIISVTAVVVLREKLTPPLIIGAALISAGIALVSIS